MLARCAPTSCEPRHRASEMILVRRPGFETMTPLPGIDHALQLFSIDLHKDT